MTKKTDRKPKRLRVFRCPYCSAISPLERKLPGEDYVLSTCVLCFRAVMNHTVESWLQ